MELISIIYYDHIIQYQHTKSVIIEAAMKFEKMKPGSISFMIDGKPLPNEHLIQFLESYLGPEYNMFLSASNNSNVLAFLQILYYLKCADESAKFQELLKEDALEQFPEDIKSIKIEDLTNIIPGEALKAQQPPQDKGKEKATE